MESLKKWKYGKKLFYTNVPISLKASGKIFRVYVVKLTQPCLDAMLVQATVEVTSRNRPTVF